MKKVKTLLVTAIAALSLSACSLQDVKDWAGNAGSTVTGFFDSVLEKMGLKEKEQEKEEEKKEEKEEDSKPEPQPEPQPQPEPCTHQDANHDGTCDLCGEEGLPVEHVDANNDHLCDVCGAQVSQHIDENPADHVCDICGEAMGDHTDANNDFSCDACGEALPVLFKLELEGVKVDYELNDQFSSEGLKVVAYNEFGSRQEINEFTVVEPSLTSGGQKEVTVNFTYGEEQKSLSYNVTVNYWTTEDLAVLADATLMGAYGVYLPYLAGYNMRTVAEYENDELVSWEIRADDIDTDAYLEIANAFTSFSETVQISKYSVTWTIGEEAIDELDEQTGLANAQAFWVTPSERLWKIDEHLYMGFDENGQFVIRNRFVNAFLDWYFCDGGEICDGTSGFSYDAGKGYMQDAVAYEYSELSADALLFPELAAGYAIMPVSFFSLNPFDESLDAYDGSWAYLIYGTEITSAEVSKYAEDLVAYGYEPLTEDGVTYYIIYDALYGYMEISFRYTSGVSNPFTQSGEPALDRIIVWFNYIAPASYTNHLDFGALYLESILNCETVYSNDYFEQSSVVPGYTYLPAEGFANGGELSESIARTLLADGFEVYSEIELVADTDGDYYYFDLYDGEFDFEFFVDAEAAEGKYYVEFRVWDSEKVSLSKEEAEAQAILGGYYGFKPLRGVDFDINLNQDDEVESATASITSGDAPESGLDAALSDAANGFAQAYLPASYEFVSEEADSANSTYTAVYRDVARGFEVTFVASVSEGKIVVDIEIVSKTFVTPETVMVSFLTAQNGAAPNDGDYTVGQDNSATANLTIADAEASAAGLQAVAEALAAKFGETFTVANSAAGDGDTWVVTLANDVSGIDAVITVGLGQESGYVAEVYVEFHVEPVVYMTPLEALTEVGSYFGKTPALGQDGSYSIGGAYKASSYSIEDLEEYLELFTPDEFTKVQDWTQGTFSDGSIYYTAAFMNGGGTVLQYYVYADDYGTEEAPVPVTVFEAYSYSVSA